MSRLRSVALPDTDSVGWLLYTTEPIANAKDVANVVDIYRARWLIEECSNALKTGCRYEQHQFESRDALLTLLVLTPCVRAPVAPGECA